MINGWPETDESKKMLLEQVRSFAQGEIAPKAKELDESGRFPAEIVKQLAEMGLMGMMVPEEFGGAGMDAVSYAMCMEEISAACASTGVIMSVNNSLVCYPIMAYGNGRPEKTLSHSSRAGREARLLRAFGAGRGLRSRRSQMRGQESAGRLPDPRHQKLDH